MTSLVKSRSQNILEKPLSRGRSEIYVGTFGLLFGEAVSYCHSRSKTSSDIQTKLSQLGYHVGERVLDLYTIREKGFKREIRLIGILQFIKSTIWKNLFGKEADQLELSNDDEKMYFIIEKESVVNKFINRPEPRDKAGSLNCASFVAGIVEAVLVGSNFPAKVTAHWYKGTAYRIVFEESVIQREKAT